GPRRSLDFSGLDGPVVLFGDEPSFALAMALRAGRQGAQDICLFEVNDTPEARTVLDAIGLGDAHTIARTSGDAHLVEASSTLVRLAGNNAHVFLTGRAPSIQQVVRSLKAAGIASSRIRSKAYWAPGKVGLD